MRFRFSCEKCDYKTTSETNLKLHISGNHQPNLESKQKQKIRKRKSCDICDAKFNKESTFITHMKKVHKQEKLEEGGQSKETLI